MWRPAVLPLTILLLLPLGRAGAALRPGQGQGPDTTTTEGKTIAALVEQAHLLEDEALRKSNEDDERAALLQRAVSVLTRALALDGHNAEARVALGRVLSSTELGEDAVRRSVQELYRARQDDPALAFDCEIAQILGIVLSRLGRFQQAVDEYDRALLRLPSQPGPPLRLRSHRATILGNSAEALMALGRLDEAIRRYGQAEALETTDQAALHTLGLAVAYDRDGQVEKSRDALMRSLTTDPAMKLFQSDSVFFVPSGDRSYYVALAAEAFGDREAALTAWQQFLRDVPGSRYAVRARVHLDELRKTPGLSAMEVYRADVVFGAPLFPPERQVSQLSTRGRSEDDVERVARGHQIELRQCYARALRKEPRLVWDLEVALVLDKSGAVALAENMRSTFSSERGIGSGAGAGPGGAKDLSISQTVKDLERCVVDSIRRWRFAQADVEHDELALPMHFEARR